MFLFPWLARRFGVEKLILAGAIIMLSRQIANVAFTTPGPLLVCSLVQGAGYALLLIGGVTFVSRQAPRGTAATAQGILSGVTVSLAAILGSGLGGQLAGLLTIRGLYAVSVCLGAVAVVLIAVAVLPVATGGDSRESGGPPGEPAVSDRRRAEGQPILPQPVLEAADNR
jgi:MFS family permease